MAKIVYQVVGLGPSQHIDVDNLDRVNQDRIEVDTDTTDPAVLRQLEGWPTSLLERGIVTQLPEPKPRKEAAAPPKE